MFDYTRKKIRVCVIGAGVSGLCAAKFLASDLDVFDFEVFERNNEVGGTWIYTDKTGNDEYGLPIHTSMYKNLRSNVPKEIMDLPDFKKIEGDGVHCCVGHEDVLKYLNDYADHFNIRQYIKFNTLVESVYRETAPDSQMTIWNVLVKNLQSGEISNFKFDAVMVCNGHFSVPYIPKIPGIETFRGKILHSHSYRIPEDFTGDRVLVLGAYISGVDISTEISEYTSQVYLSHNMKKLTCELTPGIIQVAGVERVDGNKIFLNDGTAVVVDAFIYCTGYYYSFPFLESNCDIKVDENHVTPLYKHLININHPSMCFIALGNVVLPFLMAHIQIQYFLALLKGVVKLPVREVMLEDTKVIDRRKKDFHKFNCMQWSYFDTLAEEGKFEPPPLLYKNGFEAWCYVRAQYPVSSKHFKFVVLEDGVTVKLLKPCGSEFQESEIDKSNFKC